MSIHLPDTEVALTGDLERVCLEHTGPVDRVDRLPGGNVSHVFRLAGTRGTVVVKVRGTVFARIPALTTSPGLVRVEARALAVFNTRVPDTFPDVLAVDPEHGVLVISDLGTGSVSFQDLWAVRRPDRPDIAALGAALARVHLGLESCAEVIRDEGDAATRRHVLGYCLRAFVHPVLARAADACETGRAQLVHGDLCPKNVLVADGRLLLCDLDNAHRGSRIFETGYLLGHIVLHLAGTADCNPGMLAHFQRACGDQGLAVDLDDPLLVSVMTGVLLYRLSSMLVPYPTPLAPDRRAAACDSLFRVLDSHPGSLRHLCRAMAESGRR